jgi:rfaE bifunctional protein kinase chain/domain
MKNKLGQQHICVIGDVMLDIFSHGGINRISPEAPVPILDIEKERSCLGGALNVCHNLVSLGADTEIIGVLGDDPAAFQLELLCEEKHIRRNGLLRDNRRITTCKTRFFDGDKAVLRVDKEQRDPLSSGLEKALVLEIARALERSHALILQDYNKGVLGPELIKGTIEKAKEAGIPVFVDPKFDHTDSYAGAFLIKPNRREAEALLSYKIDTTEKALKAAETLQKQLHCDNILLTLGADGMVLANAAGSEHIPGHPLKVTDITGAGDTVIAVVAALYCSGLTIGECVHFANRAAARVCEKQGVCPATPDMIFPE